MNVRLGFFALGLVVFVMVVMGVVIYKRGYFFTGLYKGDIGIGSKKQLSMLRSYLVDDKNKIVWWKFKYLDKIEVEKNKLVYGSTVPSGDVVIGCGQNRITNGGFIKIVEVLINPSLWNVEGQKKYNILFIRCSVLSYDEDYQNSVIDNFINLFNQDQFVLE